jgi:hypothetical protein
MTDAAPEVATATATRQMLAGRKMRI